MRGILVVLTFLFANSILAQKYWQQEVNYDINVTLNDETHTLWANETIEYINHSPYTLNILYFHVWPNAYKNRHTAFARQKLRDGSDEFYFANKEHRGWIDELDFEIDDKTVKWEYDEQYIDIVKITLNEPLKHGQKIIIKTPFKVKLPHTFSRLGHVQQSYQITQWFPKPAVFDKNGWQQMPYLDQGEFYSEYGKFDVKITVPENYVVAATGVLQNEKEKQWLTQRIGQKFTDDQNIPSSSETKTLHYVQDNIHDFAWFADKNYNVKNGEVTLPHSGRKVETWYMYHSRFAKSADKAIIDLHDATYVYSKFVGDYPYSAVTAVTGPLGAGGGMEYPMITITDPSAIIHEVGHNWFYGIFGTNERAFAWMDEGLNSFFENKTYDEQKKGDTVKTKKKGLNLNLGNNPKITSEFVETRNLNQPVQHHSNAYHTANYFIQLYQKPVILMRYLEDYLGEEVFIKCFHVYFDKWKFKHPYLEDMQAVFEKESGKDLNWLFHTIIKSNITPNPKIKKVVRNKRGVDALFISKDKTPIKVSSLNKDRKVISSKWIEFKNSSTNAYFPQANKLSIDDENMIFKSKSAKFSRSGSVLRKYKLPTFHKVIPQNNMNRANIGYMVTSGFNEVDKLLVGLAIYNTGTRSNKVNYTFSPMYSVGDNTVKGLATLNSYFYPKKDYHVVEIGAVKQVFQEYDKSGGHIAYWNKPTLLGVSWNQKFRLDKILVSNYLQLDQPEIDYLWYTDRTDITELTYEFSHRDAVRHISIQPKIGLYNQNNWSFVQSIEGKFSYEYMKKTRLKFRFFAGLSNTMGDNDVNEFYFGLSNGLDYAKNYYNYSRDINHSTLSNGLGGGFRGFDTVFDTRLSSINTSIGIPKIPLSVYSDVGWTTNNFHWGSGIALHLVDDMLEVYFPVAGTNFVDTTPIDAKNFFNSIRILLKLPLKSSNELIWEKI